MISRRVRDMARRDGTRVQERARGLAVSALRFSSARAVENQIPQTSKLPVSETVEEVQTQNEVTGELLPVDGWTAEGGN